ncbi:MAG: hypothetical protein ACRCXZ_01030 [Patescibacteria group bacterium]
MKKLNLIKYIKTGLISIGIIIVGLIGFNLINSYNNPYDYTLGVAHEQGMIAINTKKDWFKPTFTVLFKENPCPKDRTDITKFEYIVVQAERKLNGYYYSTKNTLGIADCTVLEEFKKVTQSKDLTDPKQNPDHNKFKNEMVQGKNNSWYAQTEEDKYYNPIDTENVASKNIEDYKKLKIGMSYDQVSSIIGKCDMLIDNGVTKQVRELICVVKNNQINFVALGWESDPISYKKNQKLINAWVVYDDRRAEELKLETLR